MSINNSEFSRVDENKTDSDLGITSSSHQEDKKHKESSFFDPDLSRHVISEIETQLPELIEYSLLGHQKNNITIPDLRVLQKRMQESVSTHSLFEVDSLKSDFSYTDFPDHDLPEGELPDSHTHHNVREGVVSTQDNSTLPDSIRKKIGAVNSYKGMNYFNSFIESFIKFKQESYKDNRTPQAAMFYTHQTQQNVQTKIDKVNGTLNLLASRLINALSETFAMIDSLAQMKPESWLSWKEFENRKREAFFYATANITGQEQPGEAFSIGERRVKLQEDPVEIMKVNSLVNAQLWNEKKYRESLWGIAPQNGESNTIDLSDPESVADVSEMSGYKPGTALSQSGGIYHSLELLLQSVSLTENAAQKVLSSNEVSPREEKSYAFSQMILLTCKKLNIILIQLMNEVKEVQPSKDALNDKASQGFIEKLHKAGREFISPAKKTAVSFKDSLPLVPRFLESAHLKIERKLTGIITRKTKSFSTQEIAAILHTGVIVKDKLQHTLISLAQINQVSSRLRFALQRLDAVTWLLEKQSSSSNSRMLIKELKDNKIFWQQIVVEEKRKLADMVNSKMDLSKGRQKTSLLLEISDILMAVTHSGKSQQAINAYFIELSKFIDYIVKCESRMKTIPDKLCDYPDARDSFSDEIKVWIRKLQAARSYLNIEITDLTGWEPASFSRTGMLAKGIAESHQERKKSWLAKYPGSSRAKAEEEYDAAFLKYIRNYLPFIAKQKAGGGELLMDRLKIEMKNAAEGKVNYPTTMAGILMAQKSTDEMFKSWSVRRLIRKSLYASLGSFSVMPSLASLPLRIAIKCLVTHAVVTFVIDKGGKAVRLGEGSSELEASKYRKNAFEQLAIKIGVSTLPFASHAIGGAFLWEDFYKGHARDAAKNVAKQLVSELPFVAINKVIDNSVNAVRQKNMAQQEQLRDFFNKIISRSRENDENSETENPVAKVKTLNVRDELYRISQGENSEQAQLAHSLLNNRLIAAIKMTQSEGNIFSQYIMSTREIQLSMGATDEEVLHEIAHALSVHQVASGIAYPDSELGEKVKQLDALRERALKSYQEQGGKDPTTLYFLSSPQEFIAGLYSGYSEFTAFLKSIDVNGRSLLLRVLDMLCELLGLEVEQENALTHALGLSDAIMATPVADEMEGEQQTYYGIAQGRLYSQYTNPNHNRRVVCNALPLTATYIPGGAIRNSLVAELAAMSPSDRNEWIANSSLTASYKEDLGIYLAENHYIYDRMVTGGDYFAWVQSFHPQWPRNFQSENRIVGVLRLPDSVLTGDFPTNKGFKLVLKNSRGDVTFERVYYPRASFEKAGEWKADIASQIEEDMLLQDKYNRISVSHIDGYHSSHPVVISGGSNVMPNVFVVDENSLVKHADFQIVDQDPDLEKTTLKTMSEARSLVARLATMSPGERNVWFLRSKLSRDMKKYTGIYLAEYQYVYDQMVKGSDYFKLLIDTNNGWPRDFQAANRIVGVLRLPNSVLTGAFPAGKGFKLILKNSSGDVISEKVYYPGPYSKGEGEWKGDILSQIEEDMLLQDESNRISVSYIDHVASTRARVVAGPSDVKMNVFVINENSQVESADFQIVNAREGSTTPDKELSADVHLDRILLRSAASEGLNFTTNDLNEKYPVSFVRTTMNTFGAANFIPPRSKIYTKEYTLRNILSNNLYRDEDFNLNSFSNVYDVDGVPGLTLYLLKRIIDRVEKNIQDKVEELKGSLELKSAVTKVYQKSLNAAFINLLSYEKDNDVIELVSLYYSRQVNISSVSVELPGSLLPTSPAPVFSVKCNIPGMVAISKGELTILASVDTGKYYIMRNNHINYNIADAIRKSLSKKDADNISPEYQAWKKWTLIYNDSTKVSSQQTLLDKLFDSHVDRLKIELDYETFTSGEYRTRWAINYGKAILRFMSILAGTTAAVGSGNVTTAVALFVGVLSEAADIGLSVVQMNNSDRGKDYNSALSEILVGSILFVIFASLDIRQLAKIANSHRQELLAVVKKTREFVDKLKRAPRAREYLVTGVSDINVMADYSRQVLDESFIEDTITTSRHHELMAGVDAQHPITPDQTGSSGYQSGNSTSQNASLQGTETPSSASEGISISGSRSSVGGTHVNSGAQPNNGATRMEQFRADVNNQLERVANSVPLPGVRGADEGRRPFTKHRVTVNNKGYDYRQYDDYKIYLPEGKDARPGRFMVSGHGNTIGTNTVACPKKTTINFYGEHGKLLEDNGLESRKMLPSARVKYNQFDQPVTEVPIINNGEIENWRTAILEERIKFTGTSKAGHYKDVKLSHFEDDNPYRAMDMWNLEKQAGTQNPALVTATPRPGGLVTIDKNKPLKLSTLVEDLASVSSTGEAVVDVNACRGGWLASLFANKNMRAGASNRYVRARPSRRYTEQNGIRSIRRNDNRTGGRLFRQGDLKDTLSPIGTGGSAILQAAQDHPKTTLKVLGFAAELTLFASAVALSILYLRGDFDSPGTTTNGQRPDTEPVSQASTEETTLILTKDEVSERVSFIITKVTSLMSVLRNNDDNALAQLRPLEKLFFGDDDYLDVHDLTQILAFFEAIKNDTTGESLKAFLEGKPTPLEIENPDNPFARLGRENVIGFLFQVLR
ncbi:putative adhesin [Candidatus Pantoea multigeneris]|uniref:Putative adhesin Stv domain-containing protein n=1 Tax=Candidatus Pantoea multigeneris TaxID=2608357 RepID=A0ABX0RIX4_9GAMM|nr:hypothetical protein [Pantoea multigeneris]NIF23200.1 hypothetical protein [Pantoea multigeneris]